MIRVGIAGLAGIGQKHFMALQEVPEVEVTALIDRDRSAYTLNSSVYGTFIPWYASLDECMEAFDVLYVCTPPSSHEALSVAALRNGKDVFCEKPISVSVESAQRMIDCAQQHRRRLCVGFNMRYRESYAQVKQILDGQLIGDPVQYWCLRIGMLRIPSHNWRIDRRELVGMTVESLSHDFDSIRWLLGEIVSVRADVIESQEELPGFDDNVSVRLKLAGGAIATITASWSSCLKKNSRGIVGTAGSVEMSGDDVWAVSLVRWQSAQETCENLRPYAETLEYKDYIGINRAFIGALDGRGSSYPDGKDGLIALKTSLAVLNSAREGTEVLVEGVQE